MFDALRDALSKICQFLTFVALASLLMPILGIIGNAISGKPSDYGFAVFFTIFLLVAGGIFALIGWVSYPGYEPDYDELWDKFVFLFRPKPRYSSVPVRYTSYGPPVITSPLALPPRNILALPPAESPRDRQNTPPRRPTPPKSALPRHEYTVASLTRFRDTCLQHDGFLRFPHKFKPEICILDNSYFRPTVVAHHEWRAGRICFNDDYLAALSYDFPDPESAFDDLYDTMMHELLHAWCYQHRDIGFYDPNRPHGPVFRAACVLLGIQFREEWIQDDEEIYQ